MAMATAMATAMMAAAAVVVMAAMAVARRASPSSSCLGEFRSWRHRLAGATACSSAGNERGRSRASTRPTWASPCNGVAPTVCSSSGRSRRRTQGLLNDQHYLARTQARRGHAGSWRKDLIREQDLMCTPISGSSSMRSCSSALSIDSMPHLSPSIFAHQSCPWSKCNGSTKFLMREVHFSSTGGARGPPASIPERYRTDMREDTTARRPNQGGQIMDGSVRAWFPS